MKKTRFVAFLFTVALASAETFTGVITDSMCGSNHTHMGISPDEKCVRECVKADKSVKYVLFDGKKMYKLSDQQTPEQFAAKKVRVTGSLFEKTGIIRVDKIEAVK